MSELSILTVHAHPDDESSKGPGTIRRYTDEGIRTTLVCCTGGEAGDILNPAMDRPEVAENLEQVRRDELALAAKIIGYDEVVYLTSHNAYTNEAEGWILPNQGLSMDDQLALGVRGLTLIVGSQSPCQARGPLFMCSV